MDFSLSDERRMLQDSLAGTLERHAGSDGLWTRLAELGVAGALLPESAGGFGGEGEDIALVFRALGKAGAVTPALESVVLGAGILAVAGGHEALIEEVIGGEARLAFAHGEAISRYGDLIAATATAAPAGDAREGWRVTGRKTVVVGGAEAQWLIVSALLDGAPALFLVRSDAPGVTRRSYPLMDGGVGAEIELDDAPALHLGPLSLADRARAAAVLAVCADAEGAMTAAFDLTLDYLKQRRQFGRPISAFQAIQHRMADLRMEIEQARSAVLNLAGNLDGPERARHVAATKVLVGRVAMLVAEEAIQLHGGIGMTEEYALGALARRLIAAEHRFGDSDHHLDRFAALEAG